MTVTFFHSLIILNTGVILSMKNFIKRSWERERISTGDTATNLVNEIISEKE